MSVTKEELIQLTAQGLDEIQKLHNKIPIENGRLKMIIFSYKNLIEELREAPEDLNAYENELKNKFEAAKQKDQQLAQMLEQEGQKGYDKWSNREYKEAHMNYLRSSNAMSDFRELMNFVVDRNSGLLNSNH